MNRGLGQTHILCDFCDMNTLLCLDTGYYFFQAIVSQRRDEDLLLDSVLRTSDKIVFLSTLLYRTQQVLSFHDVDMIPECPSRYG